METTDDQRYFTDTARALNAFYQEINDLPPATVTMLMRTWHSHLLWYDSQPVREFVEASRTEGQRIAAFYTALKAADLPPELAGTLVQDWHALVCTPRTQLTPDASQSH